MSESIRLGGDDVFVGGTHLSISRWIKDVITSPSFHLFGIAWAKSQHEGLSSIIDRIDTAEELLPQSKSPAMRWSVVIKARV